MSSDDRKDAIKIFMIILLITAFTAFIPAVANAQIKVCNANNEICERTLENGVAVDRNCISCGVSTKICGDGTQRVVPNQCQKTGTEAKCIAVTINCPTGGDPNKILKFSVYNAKGLTINATPERRSNVAGRTVEYTISVINDNPVPVDVLLEVTGPENWKIEYGTTMQVPLKSKKDFTLKVTSTADEADGEYPVKITGLAMQTDNSDVQFSGEKTVIDEIASRASATLSVEPSTQTGNPKEKLSYNVTITNNDPKDFDASNIALVARPPKDWTSTLTSRSVRIKPGENASVTLDVTPSENAKEGMYDIEINATVNGMTTLAKAQYQVSLCGNGICGVGEECPEDCPVETDFFCSGRCEQMTDTGVAFSTQVRFPFSNFMVCEKGSTPDKCLSAFRAQTCGFGKDCLCGGFLGGSECSMRCVDLDKPHAYYLYAIESSSTSGRRSNANYSYDCPFVDLNGIKQLRNDFNKAKEDFEQMQSGVKEGLNTAAGEERQRLLPCFSGLGEIISRLKDHLAFLDDVIRYPAVSNTTEARSRSVDLKKELDSLYNQYCNGAAGALKIESITPPRSTERGGIATASVMVRNTGTISYYGYVSCDFTSPKNVKNTTNTSCTGFPPGSGQPFSFMQQTDVEGTWKMQCKIIGSLKPDCSSEVHDQSQVITFQVFSKDTFVRDISGKCTSAGAECTVRLNNQFACAGCRLGNSLCTKKSQTNETTVFSCPVMMAGKYNITAYVIPTGECNPVEPMAKNAEIVCQGCGDGIVQKPAEQCELPDTTNNSNCAQTELTVIDGRRGVRDKFGYCTSECQCSLDPFIFQCVRGVGGATCNDGETRTVNQTAAGQNVSCTEQCGATCVFEGCSAARNRTCNTDSECLTGQKCINGICSLSGLFVGVSHDPQNPKTTDIVGITATSNGAVIRIFVDGLRKVECYASPCRYEQVYLPGQHTYFAVAEDSTGKAIASPSEGTKTFTVTGQAGTNTSVQIPGQNITITISHSPQNPIIEDNITFTGTANTSVNKIEIYVDNFLKKTCNSTAVCAFSQKLPAGDHDYYGVFTKNGSSARAQGQVFVTMSMAPAIVRLDLQDNVIMGANSALDFSLNNPGADRYGMIRCNVKTPASARSIASSCFSLPQMQSSQRILFVANEAGIWNVTSCMLNVSQRSDCLSSQVSDSKNNLGSFAVIQPTDIFIAAVRGPSSAVAGTVNGLNVTLQNPLSVSRYAKASCLFLNPANAEVARESACLGISANSSKTFGLTFQPDVLGTWQLASCSSDVSQASDCSGSTRTQTLQLSRQISVVKSDKLDITNAILSTDGIIIGDTVTVSATVRNPTEIDRFANVTCNFRTQNLANMIASSSCSPIRKDQQDNLVVTVKPPFVGRYNVTSCTVSSSINFDCSQAKPDDSFGPAGTFLVSSPASQQQNSSGGGGGTASCKILRFKPDCFFNKNTNRYLVQADISWMGGEHAHFVVGDDEGPKYFNESTIASKSIAVPGLLKTRLEVHVTNPRDDSDDTVLCSSEVKNVYCLPGNATEGPSVVVTRSMAETAPFNPFPVTLFIGPLADIDNFTLVEFVPQAINVTNIIVSGNGSKVSISSRQAASLNATGPLRAYIFNTQLFEGHNFSISYTAIPPASGRYTFFYAFNATDNIVQETPKTVYVTNCKQIKAVWATGPGGLCKQFPTPCDVTEGWTTIDKCPSKVEPPPETGQPADGTLAIIAIVIVLSIVIIAYRKRDAIRAKLHRNERPGEEMPTLEER